MAIDPNTNTNTIPLKQYKSTELYYWNDTYTYRHTSTITSCQPITDSARHESINTIKQSYIQSNHIQLNNNDISELYQITVVSTIFHAQGGGQPADQGVIIESHHITNTEYTACNNELIDSIHSFIVLHVEKSTLDDVDVILHYGYFNCKSHIFSTDTSIVQYIDSQQRNYNARLHSAGHIIDLATSNAGYRDKLLASKGNHFSTSPYVDYVPLCELSSSDRSEFVSRVQTEVNKLIDHKLSRVQYIEGATRMLGFGEYPCQPCGGTHINNTEQLKSVTITKLEKKGKIFRCKYKVDP